MKFSSRIFKTVGLMKKFLARNCCRYILRQMNSRSEQEVRGSVKQNLTINASFYLSSNLLALTFFSLYPCIAGNLAYQFRKCTAVFVSHQEGGGYFLENMLEGGLIVWDQEFSNRLRYFVFL